MNTIVVLVGIYLTTKVLDEPRRVREALGATFLAHVVWKHTFQPYVGSYALAVHYFTTAVIWSSCAYIWVEALLLGPRRRKALQTLVDAAGNAPKLTVENQILEAHRRLLLDRAQQLKVENQILEAHRRLLLNRAQQLEVELKARSQAPTAGLDAKTWKLLFQLAHPDRHPKERQEAAHEATTWLNTHRPREGR